MPREMDKKSMRNCMNPPNSEKTIVALFTLAMCGFAIATWLTLENTFTGIALQDTLHALLLMSGAVGFVLLVISAIVWAMSLDSKA